MSSTGAYERFNILTMLAAAAANAGIAELLDAVLSVEEVKVYKPHAAAFRLAYERLNVVAARICFLSSNGWDAYSAKAFGLRVLWCNRFGQVAERIPETRKLRSLPNCRTSF